MLAHVNRLGEKHLKISDGYGKIIGKKKKQTHQAA